MVPELPSLHLGLAGLGIQKGKRISSLCETLAQLRKLTDLSLDFSGNPDSISRTSISWSKGLQAFHL